MSRSAAGDFKAAKRSGGALGVFSLSISLEGSCECVGDGRLSLVEENISDEKMRRVKE